ncbi:MULTISPECIES: DUF2911 domain-containing protein [Tenacibaculum]|uniref:DUF2911 domain-containing protein n=1 Tax=Tenacibaculum TaxID=104267 RepID=UPI001F0AD6EE|nr:MULTISPECIES: DUF2911 domain-containing protein [Tenacibaculum]MCH3881521.1 DUF2911 domain-containing protein [Tenacibaculum aquimarinum]MCH3883587.1 DUF2911 domain-containing protein [Tenacibaculum aquimarinum]MDO6598884.1 DUF2911 domain-containing protein [Tenacibaculum sp. 1_MG-2023]
MKKSIFTIAILVIALVFTNETFAQKFSPLDKSPMDAASFPSSYRDSDKLVKVVYSRPQLKGRALDKLAPKDKVWRTGANEAAEITFYKDVTFGGKEVKAGTYTLFTIPGEKEWTVILSSASNVWGSYFYKQEEDVVRVKAGTTNSPTSIESFSLVFEGDDLKAVMYLGWGNVIVNVPIQG